MHNIYQPSYLKSPYGWGTHPGLEKKQDTEGGAVFGHCLSKYL